MKWIKLSLLILLAFITYLSLKAPAGGIEIHVNDKIGHALAYFILTCNIGILFARMRCYLAAILAFSYSCLLEYLQGFVPGRTVSIYDLYANATGSILGGLVILALYPQLKNVLKKIGLIS